MENKATQQRRYEATAKFHDRAAVVLKFLGKHDDAEAAKRAANLCRESAAKVAA